LAGRIDRTQFALVAAQAAQDGVELIEQGVDDIGCSGVALHRDKAALVLADAGATGIRRR
jgi:hypothetical protein